MAAPLVNLDGIATDIEDTKFRQCHEPKKPGDYSLPLSCFKGGYFQANLGGFLKKSRATTRSFAKDWPCWWMAD
jgi:hypothetical protein